jgi:hypothetical protein
MGLWPGPTALRVTTYYELTALRVTATAEKPYGTRPRPESRYGPPEA